jgi:hypothetical protein
MRKQMKAITLVVLFFTTACYAIPDHGLDPQGGPAFKDYRALFSFVATLEGIPADADTLLKLAAESSITRLYPKAIGELLVVEAEFRGDRFSKIRGAHNGSYYVFLKSKDGMKLVGLIVGDRPPQLELDGDQIRLVSNYHLSVKQNKVTFTWNGKIFKE